MALKIFKGREITELVTRTITNLPAACKIAEGFDTDLLRAEFYMFQVECRENGYDTGYVDKITQEEIDDLTTINWWGAPGFASPEKLYYQTQLAKKSTDSNNWNTFLPEVGDYTKEVLSQFGPIYRPRYVVTHPEWDIEWHSDWNNSSDHGFRVHLMIYTDHSNTHFVRDGNGVQEFNFEKGEAWFFNVEKEHKACNRGTGPRLSISFEMLTDTLINV